MVGETSSIPARFPAVQIDNSISCIRRACDLQIHCVIAFAGKVDELRLASAVRLSLDAEPILGCRLREGWRRQFWQRRDDLERVKIFETVAGSEETAILDFLAAPLDLCNDPLVQVRLFRGGTDTVVIKVNHIVADAGGVKEYASLLAAIYRGLGDSADFRPAVNLRGSRSIAQVTRRFGAAARLRHLGQLLSAYGGELFPPRNWSFRFTRGGDTGARTFVLHKIGADLFQQTGNYARRHGYTLNDVVLAAFYRSLYRHLAPPPGTPLRLGTTVNLRRYLPEGKGEAICNLAASFMLNIGTEIGGNFAETAARVHAAMARQKRGDLGMGDKRYALFTTGVLPFAVARTLNLAHQVGKFIVGPKTFPPLLTNMGLLDPAQFDFGVTVEDCFLTPPVAFPPLCIIGVSGFGQSLTLSVGFCPSALPRSTVESLLTGVETELAALE